MFLALALIVSWWFAALVTPRAPERLDARMIADGAGGHWLAWCERGDRDVVGLRLTRLDAEGQARSGWLDEGLAIDEAQDAQREPALALDGRGGLWLAWSDRRGGPRRIHAAHVGADGARLSPSRRLGGQGREEFHPTVMSAGDGGAYIAWQSWDGRSSDVQAIRLMPDGEPATGWPVHGLGVADSPFDECSPHWIARPEGPGLSWIAYDGPEPSQGRQREALLSRGEPRILWRDGPFGRMHAR